ncbi:hypothetical protein CBM2587_A10273 [Cupriavidus taiwanensis]|uniref:Uncharacterized protein n=1 Tax=Cupriavidus taiwanensis TaxID=164546 RepID=A0A975WRK8_9BURK|nr:hypothetical protein CBM2587_A10273 [Cupriavidus taiwanensis]
MVGLIEFQAEFSLFKHQYSAQQGRWTQ